MCLNLRSAILNRVAAIYRVTLRPMLSGRVGLAGLCPRTFAALATFTLRSLTAAASLDLGRAESDDHDKCQRKPNVVFHSTPH